MAFQLMLKKKKGSSEAFIYLRYSYKDYQDVLFSTGKKIPVGQWNEAKQRPNQSYKGGTVELIRYLDEIKGKVTKVVTTIENEGEEPIPEKVKERYEESTAGVYRGAIKAATLWETFIKNNSNGKSEGSVRNERNSLRTFIEFTTYIRKPSLTPRLIGPDLLADYEDYLNTHGITFAEFLEAHPDLDRDIIAEYYKWLEARPKKPTDKMKVSTKGKKLKHFKRFLKSLKHPLVDEIKYKDGVGHKLSFTEAEMELIEAHDFSKDPRLRKIQDLTLLQANTGLRISDRKRLGVQHKESNAISIKTKKTGHDILVPITPTVQAIFERNNYKQPELSDQKFNDGLKDLVKIVLPNAQKEIVEYRGNDKIFRTVYKWEIASSHSLVRTFVNIRAKRGMPLPAISLVTGKSLDVLLKHYVDYEKDQAYQDAIKYSESSKG